MYCLHSCKCTNFQPSGDRKGLQIPQNWKCGVTTTENNWVFCLFVLGF